MADLDLSVIEEVRTIWQFFRDRRPETYAELGQLLPYKRRRACTAHPKLL